MSALDILLKTDELLADGRCWTKGSDARDKSGVRVDIKDPAACRFCLAGAMYRAVELLGSDIEASSAAIQAVLSQISRTSNGDEIRSTFNDDPQTKFADVKAVLAGAIEEVRQAA